MKRQGILNISRELARVMKVSISDALPPEHRVIATRDCEGWPWIEHLIEGPHMPAVADEGVMPQQVTMVVRQEVADGRVTGVFASWPHLPGVEWRIERNEQ